MGLGARLAVVFAVVAAATAALVGSASYITTDRQVTAEIDAFLTQRATEISNGQRDLPRDRRDGDEDRQVIVAVSPDAEVQVLDGDSDVISNSGLALPVDATDRALADDGGKPVLRTVAIRGTDYRMITEPLSGSGAIQVARSLDEADSLLAILQTRIIIVTVSVALAASGAGWLVAKRTTRPLRALTDAVDEVAQTRNFVDPVPASGSDEVGRLARGFNRMLKALKVSQHQQRQLVQDAAHELRTPLTSMKANVEWLMKVPNVDVEARNATLSSVHRELGELNDLMSEIIELATTDSHQPPEPVPTDLAAVANGVLARFGERTRRQLAMKLHPAVVMGDADSLARAMDNLLNNAHKYSPPDAPIAVEVGPGGVYVDDAGPGIPVEERDLVLDRFYRRTEHRSVPGSGLGLAIVAGIVEQYDGILTVDDSPLGGARIGFTLPAV